AATRSIASRARSRLHTLTINIMQLPSPRNWAMAVGSNGYRAALVSRQLTPGLISSSRETAGFPPFISFSTSYPDWTLLPTTPRMTNVVSQSFWIDFGSRFINSGSALRNQSLGIVAACFPLPAGYAAAAIGTDLA